MSARRYSNSHFHRPHEAEYCFLEPPTRGQGSNRSFTPHIASGYTTQNYAEKNYEIIHKDLGKSQPHHGQFTIVPL